MDAAIERLLAKEDELSDEFTEGDLTESGVSSDEDEEGAGVGKGKKGKKEERNVAHVSEGSDDDDENDDDNAVASSSSSSSSSDDDGPQPQAKGFLKGEKMDSFSRAFNRLVENVEGSSKAPILAGSKSIHRRKEEEKLELEASKAAKKMRDEMKKRGHYLPAKRGIDPQRDSLEKRLQKTATKGVVQLFNAINTAQKRIRSEDTQGNKAKAAKLGKAGFLAGIQQVRERQNQVDAASGKMLTENGVVQKNDPSAGGWDVLKDGFVGINDSSVRLRDWDAKQSDDGHESDGAPSDDSDDDGF